MARALPAADDVGGGLRAHCRQLSREVEYFAYDAGSVPALAARVRTEDAVTWLTVPTADPAQTLADLEVAGLILLARAEWLMTTNLQDRPESTPTAPYRLREHHEGPVLHYTAHDASGAQAARGTMGLTGPDAIADKVLTEPAHRRHGLGRAVMGALTRDARTRGATRGLLVASAEGRSLYTTLGWRPVAQVLIAAVPGTVYPS